MTFLKYCLEEGSDFKTVFALELEIYREDLYFYRNQYGRAYMYLATNLMRDICLSLRLRGVNYRKIEDDYPDYDRIRGNADKPIYKRTKNPNKMALFNTTRNRFESRVFHILPCIVFHILPYIKGRVEEIAKGNNPAAL